MMTRFLNLALGLAMTTCLLSALIAIGGWFSGSIWVPTFVRISLWSGTLVILLALAEIASERD